MVPSPRQPPPEAAPARHCPDPPDEPPELPRGRITFIEAPGRPTISVEIARRPRHRRRGLMYRTQLGEQAGMLFSWPEQHVRSFWMRNTCIPLDMVFIAADATIVGILEQVPTLNDAPRRIRCPAAHVLEVNAGWTREHGVRAGQRIEIDS